MFQIGIVIVQIFVFAVYRIYISKMVFPNNSVSATIVGDGNRSIHKPTHEHKQLNEQVNKFHFYFHMLN